MMLSMKSRTRRVAIKPPSTEVVWYSCSVCETPFETRERADAHCRCSKCGVVFDADYARKIKSWHGDLCERCTIKSRIRHVQESIRREERSLESSRASLARLREELDVMDSGTSPAEK
jgi:hypothetical protein